MGTFSDQQQTQHRHSVTNVYGIQTKMKLHFKLFALFAALAAASAVTGSKDPEAALVQVNESQSDSTSVAALHARIAALESEVAKLRRGNRHTNLDNPCLDHDMVEVAHRFGACVEASVHRIDSLTDHYRYQLGVNDEMCDLFKSTFKAIPACAARFRKFADQMIPNGLSKRQRNCQSKCQSKCK